MRKMPKTSKKEAEKVIAKAHSYIESVLHDYINIENQNTETLWKEVFQTYYNYEGSYKRSLYLLYRSCYALHMNLMRDCSDFYEKFLLHRG